MYNDYNTAFSAIEPIFSSISIHLEWFYNIKRRRGSSSTILEEEGSSIGECSL